MDATPSDHPPLSPESFARIPLPVANAGEHFSAPTSLRVDPPLETERLVLREFRREDEAAVHSYSSDPEVVRFLPWGPSREADTRDFVLRMLEAQASDPRSGYVLAVTLRDTGRLVGGCDISLSQDNPREGSLGYCYHRDVWGQGYATEASIAMLHFAFTRLRMHRVYALCDPLNLASARVLEKCGMRREGHLRGNLWIRGEWRDTLLYAVLENEWEQVNQSGDSAGPPTRPNRTAPAT